MFTLEQIVYIEKASMCTCFNMLISIGVSLVCNSFALNSCQIKYYIVFYGGTTCAVITIARLRNTRNRLAVLA